MPQPASRQFSGIFISYRRDDSAGHAGRLFDKLSAHFGEDQVFMDIDHIEPGEDFVQVIEDAVGSCEILLTVIGRRWLSSADGAARRLDNPHDFVRLEVAAALQRNIRLIPVLVEGAAMPVVQDLPDDLARLSRRQALELSDQRWHHDVSRLISTLEDVLAERKEARLKLAQAEEEKRLRHTAEDRRGQEAEEQLRREAEDRHQREKAAAEQRRRDAEAERERAAETRRAEELEHQRGEAEEAALRRTEAGEPTRDRRAGVEMLTPAAAKPRALGRRALLAAAVGAALVAGAVVAWQLGMTGEQKPAEEVRGESTTGATGPGQSTEPPVGQGAAHGPAAPEGMVYVPGGEFTMGRDGGDPYESPAHSATVKPFFIDTHEATCGDYVKFTRDAGHRPSPPTRAACTPGAALKPITGVNWDEADTFCRARGKRLPTEEEWEFAARGRDGRRYPWGDEWRAGSANADGAARGVVNVGSYPEGRSPFDAFDMVGNAWEWTATDLAPYREGSRVGKLPPSPYQNLKVIRGCMHGCNREQATTTYRRGWPPNGDHDYGNTGFRCVKDAER